MSILPKLTKIIKYGSALITVLALNPGGIFAQGTDTVNLQTGVNSTISGLKPSVFITAGINILLGGAGIVAFFFLLIGGVQWILAGGDKEGTEKARKRITNALIGLAIVLSAYALLFIMSSLFNIDLLNFTLKPLGDYRSGSQQ